MENGNRLIARWASRGGGSIVELWREAGSGYCYRAVGASGYLGNHFASDSEAFEAFEPRIGDFQPNKNRTPMRRIA